MAKRFKFLSPACVNAHRDDAADRGVSKVARSKRGFATAYARAGSAAKLPERWQKKRAAFIARHRAQMRKNNEPLFDDDGRPTRRHLALIMWAYSPTGRCPRS